MPTIIINSEKIKLTRLSRGSFARVYLGDNGRVYHFVNTNRSCEREAVSMFASGEHVPQIDDHGKFYLDRVGWLNCYSMPLYNPLNNANKKLAALLRKTWAKHNHLPHYTVKGYAKQDHMMKQVQNFIDDLESQGYEELAQNIQEIYDAIRNYDGSFWLEFPNRNLKQDQAGNLILLDIVFNIDTL